MCLGRCRAELWLRAGDFSEPYLYPVECWGGYQSAGTTCGDSIPIDPGIWYGPYFLAGGFSHWFQITADITNGMTCEVYRTTQTGTIAAREWEGPCPPSLVNAIAAIPVPGANPRVWTAVPFDPADEQRIEFRSSMTTLPTMDYWVRYFAT